MKPNLLALLEQLEQLVSEAPRIPMTDKIVVDGEAVLDLLEQVRYSLPDEVLRAKKIENDRERLISAGQKDAEKIIRQAEEYARKLVDEHEVLKAAKEEAKKIIAEAEIQAKEMTKGADEYAAGVLEELSVTLQKTLSVVEKGRQKLKNS
ncbi:MAG: hypothetical protein H0Z38_06020 [Firmicutes bacterium]|nr:hypothetical protein [Bacillota bacterium]